MTPAKIECCECRNCFEAKEVKYSMSKIPDKMSSEELEKYINTIDDVRFDCPECECVLYLSDCEIF